MARKYFLCPVIQTENQKNQIDIRFFPSAIIDVLNLLPYVLLL